MNSVLFLSDWGRKLGKEISKSFGKKKLEYNPKKWNIVKGDMVITLFFFIFLVYFIYFVLFTSLKLI